MKQNRNRNTPDSCQKDSGGPLVTRLIERSNHFAGKKVTISDEDGISTDGWQNGWTQLGVVSFGVQCGQSYYPAVYTNVAYYYDFIRSFIRNDI